MNFSLKFSFITFSVKYVIVTKKSIATNNDIIISFSFYAKYTIKKNINNLNKLFLNNTFKKFGRFGLAKLAYFQYFFQLMTFKYYIYIYHR